MLTRRSAVLAPLAAAAIPQVSLAANTKMGLSIHMTTTQNAGYKGCLEGWAKAGIKYVEVTDRALDDFLKTESIATAKRMIGDLGLTVVSCASVLQDFWNKNPGYAAQLETWKKRCEQYAAIGSPRIYCPSTTNRKVTADDYKTCPEAIREAGDIAKQHNLIAMIEFTRASTLLSTLTTSLKVIREANHPNVKPMLDCYHFWSGMSKFEDLDLLQPGELAHAHFNDTPNMERELLAQQTRLIPGDGIAPLVKILQKLSEKNYSGALSVELFIPELQQGDPQQGAAQIRAKCEKVMSSAGVL